MKKAMAVGFFLMLILPNVGYQIMKRIPKQEQNRVEISQKVQKPETEADGFEKRELTRWPEFDAKNLSDYTAQIENYIGDHAPFRSLFLSTYATINEKGFGTIDNTQVIVGKKGWLFYSADGSRTDATDANIFSDEQCQQILDQLLALRTKVVDDPAEFIFYIVPRKERIYTEYMPDGYQELISGGRVDSLIQYIRLHSDIRVLYPYEELMAVKEQIEKPLYYRMDTHWNLIGGFVGAQALIWNYGGQTMAASDLNIVSIGDRYGDLLGLGHLQSGDIYEPEWFYDNYEPETTYEIPVNDTDGSGICTSYTPQSQDPRSITLVHDSYGEALKPVLMPCYRETRFLNWNMLGTIPLGQYQSDLFVYEAAEWNLNRLLSETSWHSAP